MHFYAEPAASLRRTEQTICITFKSHIHHCRSATLSARTEKTQVPISTGWPGYSNRKSTSVQQTEVSYCRDRLGPRSSFMRLVTLWDRSQLPLWLLSHVLYMYAHVCQSHHTPKLCDIFSPIERHCACLLPSTFLMYTACTKIMTNPTPLLRTSVLTRRRLLLPSASCMPPKNHTHLINKS